MFFLLVASYTSTTGQETRRKIRSAALAEFKDARNFVMVCPAVEKTRSEGAGVEGIHKILPASKANRLKWYWLSRHHFNGLLNSILLLRYHLRKQQLAALLGSELQHLEQVLPPLEAPKLAPDHLINALVRGSRAAASITFGNVIRRDNDQTRDSIDFTKAGRAGQTSGLGFGRPGRFGHQPYLWGCIMHYPHQQ